MTYLRITTTIAILCTCLSLSAQTRTVNGIVRDTEKAPVAGAVITVNGKESTSATYARADGTFSIQASDSDIITIQMLSFGTQEVRIGSSSFLDIVLESDAEELEQVVVTGYQVISKERATGSFDIVGKAQLSKPAANIANRLLGSSASLVTTQDAYGNVTSFKIRGTSSFSAASSPLLVVDGFPVSGGFESINPNDVESVTVLKDAAAASIWGARSANGVIVVTTKNGSFSSSGTVVTAEYSTFLKMMPKTDLDYALSRASSSDVIDYELYAYDHYASTRPEASQYTGGASKVYELLQERDLGYISESKCASEIEKYRGLDNKQQIRDYLLQSPLTNQHNLSVNVRTQKSSTSLSALFMDNDEALKGNSNKTYMVSMNNNISIFKWLDFTLNAMYDRKTYKRNGQSFSGLSPYEMLYDENGDPIWYSSGINLNFIRHNIPSGIFPSDNWGWNPAEELSCVDNSSTNSLARVQAGLSFKILKGLVFDVKAQYEGIESNSRNYSSPESFSVRTLLNTTSKYDASKGAVSQNYPSGGTLGQSRSSTSSLNLRTQIGFNRTFDKHTIAFVAGAETTDTVMESFAYPVTYGYNDTTLEVGLFPNGIPAPGADSELMLKDWRGNDLSSPSYTNSFSYMTDRYFSAYANLSYTFNQKYTISGSVRTDASNLITDDPKYRYAPFWSVGANWKIGKEQFLKNVSWLDDLTLRATLGDNGNVDKSTSFRPLVYTSASVDQYTNERYGGMSSLGNPTLRWERTRTFNAGVDFDLFSGLLFGKIDYYYKHSFDLIADRQLPYYQGTSSIRLNNGEILNNGFEAELGTQWSLNKDISLGARVMVSYNHNRVLALDKQPVLFSSLVRESPWLEGHGMNTLWCYKYGGMKNVGTYSSPIYEPTIENKEGDIFAVTNSIFGNAIDFSYDCGTMSAPVNASLQLEASIYDFEVSLLFTGKTGHVFRRESFNYPQIFYSSRAIPNSKYFEIANCDPEKMIPLPQNQTENNLFSWGAYYPYMSYLVENASVIRMQEINVTYHLPSSIAGKAGLAGASVFAVCNNPFNIYFNSYNEDPDYPKGGMRLQTSVTAGIEINF